jgi:RNA polymerase subunit RPABC4/transcription elongation factor Spt4
MYVIDDQGNRVVCPHPGEFRKAHEVLGDNYSEEVVAERTGFNSHCLCLDCLTNSDLDMTRDRRECPNCHSQNISTILELVGKQCPKCNDGKIQASFTGLIS